MNENQPTEPTMKPLTTTPAVQCDGVNSGVCFAHINAMHDKLDVIVKMHEETREEMKTLRYEVKNGITTRLNTVEKTLSIIQNDQQHESQNADRRRTRLNLWEGAFALIVVGATCTFMWFLITKFVKEQTYEKNQFITDSERRENHQP